MKFEKAKQRVAHLCRKQNKMQRVGHPGRFRSAKDAPPALQGSVFGLLLLATEARTAGRATGVDDYVVVGIENLDC